MIMDDDEKQWWDWCKLIEKTDADRAYDDHFLAAFSSCLDAYDLDDITDVGEIRGCHQWSRIWCIEDGRYEWR
jgi:hypothetical protein